MFSAKRNGSIACEWGLSALRVLGGAIGEFQRKLEWVHVGTGTGCTLFLGDFISSDGVDLQHSAGIVCNTSSGTIVRVYPGDAPRSVVTCLAPNALSTLLFKVGPSRCNHHSYRNSRLSRSICNCCACATRGHSMRSWLLRCSRACVFCSVANHSSLRRPQHLQVSRRLCLFCINA